MGSEQPITSRTSEPHKNAWFLPREHGATAMLLTPIVCVAILSRTWRWSEVATLTAAFAALAAKDPMVVLARQRFVWKQWHPETAVAVRWFAGWLIILILSGLVLLAVWPFKALVAMGLGVAVFSVLAIGVNVKNRQRSTLFQIASAAALTSSSLATSLSATGGIAPWCWWLWLLLALQATAGILVVHARLDARIALRSTAPAGENFRRAAEISLVVLACAAVMSAVLGRGWIALALMVAVVGYSYDLHAQQDAAKLQLSLMKVGRRALALSSLYSVLLIIGFW
ncbi:MAG TPA: YwiC-like family protein [Terracidiphilus sp.]|nr:YwiC-like family protein [Terracidiphilus sp.]